MRKTKTGNKYIFKCWAVEGAGEKCSSKKMIWNERLIFFTSKSGQDSL